jgi:hypothetical protein
MFSFGIAGDVVKLRTTASDFTWETTELFSELID